MVNVNVKVKIKISKLNANLSLDYSVLVCSDELMITSEY